MEELVSAALAVVLLAQQLAITASVDRQAVARGDTVVVTIRVEAYGNAPVRVAMPQLSGLELVDSRETSQVEVLEGTVHRITVRQLRLVARSAGSASVSALVAEQGAERAEAPPIRLAIGGTVTQPVVLDPPLKAVVNRLEPAGTGEVSVVVVPSRRAVMVGDQVDLVTAAWFPREIRSRLRTVPALSGPEVQGAWVYEQNGPAGVVASRRVKDRWYDLYLQYQTIFPLESGTLKLGRAAASYSVPLSYSFLSREVSHLVQSDSTSLEVAPLPPGGRPAGFRGAVAGGLTIRSEPRSCELGVGEACTVTLVLEGRGNTALWPEPEVTWPVGLRAYPSDVEIQVARERGVVRGRKAFHYLLVADSAGIYRVRAAPYAYYDLDLGRYQELTAAPLEIAARPGRTSPWRTTAPLELMPSRRGLVLRPTRWPAAVWAVLGVLPLLVWGGSRLRWPRAPVAAARPAPGGHLDWLDRRFRRELERLVPEAERREGEGLAEALRAAGVETPLANHVSRVRERLRQRLYGPAGAADAEELAAEVEAVLQALVGEGGRALRAGGLVVLLGLVCGPGARPAAAQGVSPERLYQTGALKAAADSFAARAAREPEVAAHWFNAGTAWYRLGDAVRAEAAWLKAARLAPRERAIRRALELAPPADAESRRLLWVGPVSPDEALALGAGLWLAGTAALAWRRARRWAPLALVLAAAAAGYGSWVERRYRQPVALVLAHETPLREAPYGSARAPVRLPDGAAVLVRAARPGWYLVAHGPLAGWVLQAEVLVL